MVNGCNKPANDLALQNLLDTAISDGVPGISAAIATKDGIIWTGVAGKADITRNISVKEDHLFGIGSITKTFVAVVTLQLAEEGRLSLDQTPQDILGADVVGKIPGADRATIAQLLNHTSGIPSWEDDPLWKKEGRGEKLDVKRLWQRKDTLPYIEHTPLTNEPGEKYSYANTNHTLLGLIIEKITGNDVVDEIRNRILTPVGISEIYLEGFQDVPKDKLANRYHYATPEFKRDAGIAPEFNQVTDALIDVAPSNLSVEWTAGGMVASARDLARYAAAYRNGKLLKAESMAFVKQWFPVNDKYQVGHGLFHTVISPSKHPVLGHSGSVLGYTGALYWHEEKDISIVVLANVGTMHIGQSLPNASSVAMGTDFMEQAIVFANSQRK